MNFDLNFGELKCNVMLEYSVIRVKGYFDISMIWGDWNVFIQ